MSNSWDEMAKAKEDQYFKKLNEEALARFKEKSKDSTPRKHPVTGEPLVQRALYGAVIDYCPMTGGMWLDAGELEIMIENAKDADSKDAEFGFISNLGKLLKIK
jgi:hypothetical protein